jgi:hypothetical protein
MFNACFVDSGGGFGLLLVCIRSLLYHVSGVVQRQRSRHQLIIHQRCLLTLEGAMLRFELSQVQVDLVTASRLVYRRRVECYV